MYEYICLPKCMYIWRFYINFLFLYIDKLVEHKLISNNNYNEMVKLHTHNTINNTKMEIC